MADHARKPSNAQPEVKPEEKKPIALPWQATVPYLMAETPMPLDKPVDTTTATTTATTDTTTATTADTTAATTIDPAILAPMFGNYADGPLSTFEKPTDSGMLKDGGLAPTDQKILPAPILSRKDRTERIAAQETVLDAANYVTPFLPQPWQTPYLEGQLGYLKQFSDSVKTDPNIHGVPNELIDNARPLIQQLEARQPGVNDTAAGNNPEGAHVGTGTDWNTKLGVPQYRTQSDNLTSPEATCNITSLAMSLERLGYGRENALTAIDTQMREKYLEQQRAALKKKKGDLSTLPESADDVVLPDGYFEGEVKSYLKAQNANAGKPYQGLRGKKTDEKFWDAAAARYRNDAQFEDTLDFLRHLTGAGARTDLDTITPKLLEKLEPDADKRPTFRTITPNRNMNWDGARTEAQTVLDDGGAAMLSFFHKGGRNHSDSHIISMQQLNEGGFIADDPYGGARQDYNVDQTGDAFGWKGQGGRDTKKKNQLDASRTTTASQLDSDWTANAGQNLKKDETFGRSAAYTDEMFEDSWKSIRFLERAKPKVAPEVQ